MKVNQSNSCCLPALHICCWSPKILLLLEYFQLHVTWQLMCLCWYHVASASSDLDGVTQLWLQHSKTGFVLVVLSCHLDCHWQFMRKFLYTNWHTEIRFHSRDACVHVCIMMTAVFAWYHLFAKNLIHRIWYCTEDFFFSLSKQDSNVWDCVLLPCSVRDGFFLMRNLCSSF